MPAPRPHPGTPPGGFTLVELLIVIVMLGILGAVALPAGIEASADSVAVSLATNVRRLNSMVEFQFHASGKDAYPTIVDPTWFASNGLPRHPERAEGVPQLQTVLAGSQQHPADKVLTTSSAGAFWYNADAGIVRARILSQPTTQETVGYYNQVNGTQLASLSSGSTSASRIRSAGSPARR